MNFFARQRRSRLRSGWLLLGFLLALAATGFCIHLAVGALSWLQGDSVHPLQPSLPAAALNGIIWLAMLFGGGFRYLDVRGGGVSLARRFGAVAVEADSRDPHHRTLLRVTAEMAIASATPEPQVFVLPHEQAINALVVGAGNGGSAIIVSRGALAAFDQDQLRAVVAHEFGHIANGDMVHNMRLLIVLGGLLAIDEIGRLLIGDDPDGFAHPGVLIGYLLTALGSIGLLAGSLLRAAFSRQREYLADASAVQFTRDPPALASALALIESRQALQPPHGLHGVHARELAHLCIQSGQPARWYSRWLDSHPPLAKRIAAIDPHHASRRRRRHRRRSDEASARTADTLSPGACPESIDHRPDAALGDQLSLLLMDDAACVAALFILFCEPGRMTAQAGDDPHRQQLTPAVAGWIERLGASPTLQETPLRLPVIEQVVDRLRQTTSPACRQQLLRQLEHSACPEKTAGLTTWAEWQIVRYALADDVGPAAGTTSGQAVSAAPGFDDLGESLAVLLSLVIEASGAPLADQEVEFRHAMRCYTSRRLPRRHRGEPGILADLQATLERLRAAAPSIRKAVLEHCGEITDRDDLVTVEEGTLLRLIGIALADRRPSSP